MQRKTFTQAALATAIATLGLGAFAQGSGYPPSRFA